MWQRMCGFCRTIVLTERPRYDHARVRADIWYRMVDRKKVLARNTAIMALTSLVLQGIGMGYSAFLSARIGAQGVGLYQLMMSVYFMAVTVATSGMHIAATRLGAEAQAHGESLRRVLSTCLRVSGVMGLFACALLFTLADKAALVLGNAQAVYPLRILSLGLPFVAMSVPLGGYFTARRKMGIYGMVHITEELLRVGMTILALRFLPGDSYAILAVAFGIAAANALGFFLMLGACLIDVDERGEPATRGLLRGIARIALPSAAGVWLRSALGTVEQMLTPLRLGKAPGGEHALADYGLVRGMAMPILSFPSALVGALGGMLVPELTQMRVLGQTNGIRRTAMRAIRITLLYSFIVAFFLMIFAGPLSRALYKNEQVASVLRALVPLIPMLYLDSMVDHMLRSLDQQVYCMQLNTLDCVLRVLFVWFLFPVGGVGAYIALIYVSEAFNFAFSLKKLLQVVQGDAGKEKCKRRWHRRKAADLHGAGEQT